MVEFVFTLTDLNLIPFLRQVELQRRAYEFFSWHFVHF